MIFFWFFRNKLNSFYHLGFVSDVFMNTPSDCLFRLIQLFAIDLIDRPWFSSIVCLTLWINLTVLIQLERVEFLFTFWYKLYVIIFFFSNSLRILSTNDLATQRKHAISKSSWSVFHSTITACLFISFVSTGSVIINYWKIKGVKVNRKQY